MAHHLDVSDSVSLEDKLILLRARHAEGLPSTHEANDKWVQEIRGELPAFAARLLAYRPPLEMALDPRSRVSNFWHPDLVAALREMQPEMRLLELIDSLKLIDESDGGPRLWEGTATEFQQQMLRIAGSGSGILERMFTTTTTAGRMLSELARVDPDRVTKTDRSGTSHYRIFPKAPAAPK